MDPASVRFKETADAMKLATDALRSASPAASFAAAQPRMREVAARNRAFLQSPQGGVSPIALMELEGYTAQLEFMGNADPTQLRGVWERLESFGSGVVNAIKTTGEAAEKVGAAGFKVGGVLLGVVLIFFLVGLARR